MSLRSSGRLGQALLRAVWWQRVSLRCTRRLRTELLEAVGLASVPVCVAVGNVNE